MKFGKSQKLKFDSENGSYSIVTDREYFDSQITATDSEAELLFNFFGKDNINLGNVGSNKEKSRKCFKLYPNGQEIVLNLVFPKLNKTELRLYMSSRAGFKPESGSVWFMFVKNDNLWIGGMSEKEWRNENSIIVYDESEAAYQDSLAEFDEIKINTLKGKDIFARDRNLALKRIRIENFQCEFDLSHKLFESRHTNRPYLEAHHLVPMALQKVTAQKLDVLDNIFSLCPFCHRAIHHANIDLIQSIIIKLIDKRPQVLDIMNITSTDVFSFYSVENIG